MKPEESVRLNNELLKAEDPPSEEEKRPKRNSKEELTAKILKVVEAYQLEFNYSDTKLRRMNKQELTKLLAEVTEEGVKHDMAKAVGVDPRAHGKVVTLGALRMLHNLCAGGFEKGFNTFGTPYLGYEVDGFAETLRDPAVQSSVDECLLEIAAENPEILEYFDSPYSRLALVWSGALISCIKKKELQTKRRRQYAGTMGPEAGLRPSAPSSGGSGGKTVREVDSHFASRLPNVRQV
jgi:hypothetical protein